MDVETAAYWVMAAALFPIWLTAGVADYVCHRRTRIETTSGLPESISHLVQASLMGAGVMMLLFFDLNLLVLAGLAIVFALHEAVTQWDLRIADAKREITTVEQHVHAYLTAIPFAALAIAATVVVAEEKYAYALTWRTAPASVYAPILLAMAVFGAVPYWEEFWRCWRAWRKAHPTAPIASALST